MNGTNETPRAFAAAERHWNRRGVAIAAALSFSWVLSLAESRPRERRSQSALFPKFRAERADSRDSWFRTEKVSATRDNQEDKPLPVVTHYDLRFALLLKENKLEADALIKVKNETSRPVSEIPFLLYRLFDVLEIADEPGASLPFTQTVVKFSDEKSLQANLVSVRLKTPLSPEKDIAVRMKYEGTLWGYPEVMAYVKDRIDENYSLLRPDALAYPILAGASFQSLMAAFRTAFTYRVEAEVPAGYLIACGGRPLETREKGEFHHFPVRKLQADLADRRRRGQVQDRRGRGQQDPHLRDPRG